MWFPQNTSPVVPWDFVSHECLGTLFWNHWSNCSPLPALFLCLSSPVRVACLSPRDVSFWRHVEPPSYCKHWCLCWNSPGSIVALMPSRWEESIFSFYNYIFSIQFCRDPCLQLLIDLSAMISALFSLIIIIIIVFLIYNIQLSPCSQIRP